MARALCQEFLTLHYPLLSARRRTHQPGDPAPLSSCPAPGLARNTGSFPLLSLHLLCDEFLSGSAAGSSSSSPAWPPQLTKPQALCLLREPRLQTMCTHPLSGVVIYCCLAGSLRPQWPRATAFIVSQESVGQDLGQGWVGMTHICPL